MAEYTLAINIVTKSNKQGVQDANKELTSFGKNLNSTLETLKKNAVAAAAVGATFKKAFDLAQEGANIKQLGESFDGLNARVLHTPDLLNDMRAAVKGTVGDTELMQGVLKLTAGASDELAQSFAQAAPQLLEISKAANKLNPSLGDTSFLYDSISTGIKRASPLILDNLGIVVKVGEANESYAASLGKTVDQLTAEDKQMALLNATLESGNRLIDQVGGNVDSSADAYARLEVQVGKLTTGFKLWLAEGLTPVIGGLTETIEASNNGLSSLDKFRVILGEISPVAKEANREHLEGAKAAAAQADEVDGLIAESQALIAQLHQTTDATEDNTESVNEWAEQYKFTTAVIGDTIDENERLEVSYKDIQAAEERRIETARQHALAIQELGAQIDNTRGPIADLIQAQNDATLSAEESAARQMEAHAAISESYRTMAFQIIQAEIASKYEGDALAAQLAAIQVQESLGLISAAEAELLRETATKTNLIQEATSQIATAFFEDGDLTVQESEIMAEAIRLLEEGIAGTADEAIGLATELVTTAAELDKVSGEAIDAANGINGLPDEKTIVIKTDLSQFKLPPELVLEASVAVTESGKLGGITHQHGGYTGGNRNDIVGLVHGEEYVFSAPAVDRLGLPFLENLHRGGGASGGGPSSITMSVVVQGDVKDEKTLRRITEGQRSMLDAARQLGVPFNV